ncbi:class I SAM-dependent methyltransferase [Mycolicibacterium confluentis]|uniref:class I SAM-dependent methyltransferase n=1 Tax=Mycolicibacterium confluentis TaxID=28047 RepID=UPI000A2178A5|nr:class I SAM-dependent methyltransferase [Mycolicibacterium confluentis]MCV7318107.1 class I SAM-dependent methyltransferase [Mycolicibacterium confluentis]ORV31258.1 methyltransferase [Mycolicibacterium confluentis]
MSVDLTGPQQTMLATLYAKALDADAAESVLGDSFARDAVARIDYDWKRTTITARQAPGVAARSKHFDTWTRQFLAVHDRATVLHLGCGLDSRVFRIDPGAGVEWFDVDHPDVIALRERVHPQRDHVRTIGTSVTDLAWLDRIPTEAPTLVLAEGLTMYLTRTDGVALLRGVVNRFDSGEVQFDAFNPLGIRLQWTNAVVRRSGSTLHWGISGQEEILAAVPGLRALWVGSVFESEELKQIGGLYRWLCVTCAAVPGLRGVAQYHRYGF